MRWQELGIDISKVRGGKTICPKCSHTRKHKSDPCLSVDIQEGLFNCHNCGFSGSAKVYQKKEFIKPLPRLEKVSEKVLNFFEGRKISNNTLLRFGITEATEWMPLNQTESRVICFNYYRVGELINIKFRGQGKAFKMQKDAELIFYNLDAIKDETEIIICEGEIDCLSFHESGLFNSISVPNGASKGNQKLEYLDNCWREFEDKTKIILAVDNDEAGNSLREELSRRLGKERCFTVTYPEGCKDSNEVLVKYGKEAVNQLVKNARPYPLEGVLEVEDLAETVQDYFLNGYPKGFKCGISGFDDHLQFSEGQLTMVTGIPGHGKDEFVNAITTGLALNHGWKFGDICFEETPAIKVSKLIEKWSGKAFDFRKDLSHRMTSEQFEKGLLWVNEFYKFVNTDEVDVTVEGVVEKIEQMVKRYGINGVVISPWNCFEHNIQQGENETLYTSRVLGKLITCLRKYNLHCFLIAHPTKIQKNRDTGKYEVPNLYSISGSANFFNKTHNGFTVYRDEDITDVHIQKVKQSWLGKKGLVTFKYNSFTRQYENI